MKASELKSALTHIGDDDDVEFLVNNQGLKHVAEPTHAQITTKWEIPERGDLRAIPDDLPKTMPIHLEI
jgi:hypothetical protein